MTAVVEWASAGQPMTGESVSGDAVVVETWPGGALAAVIDALGHGPEAAEAARVASEILRRSPSDPPLQLLLQCHEGLRRTRGIALTLASFSARGSSVTWAGIGNIETFLIRAAFDARPARESVLLRGGIVGYQIPTPRFATLPIFRGDTMVAATDGISSGFAIGVSAETPLQELVDQILHEHRKGFDDALVAAVRYAGEAP